MFEKVTYKMYETLDIFRYGVFPKYFVKRYWDGNRELDEELNILEPYGKIINNFVDLSNSFGFENPTEIFALFNILYENGYLSFNHKFVYSEEPLLDLHPFLGSNVARGRGCCRHLANFLKDILNYKGIESYVIPVSFFEDSNDFISSFLGDHLVVVAIFEDMPYYFDPTNGLMLSKGRSFDGNYLIDDIGKPLFRVCESLFEFDNNESKDKLSKVMSNDKRDLPSLNKDIVLYEKTIDFLEAREALFDRFYADNKDFYDDITLKILSI